MAASTRKKSVVSSIDIPLPTQTNTLLNKSASSSSSLYQQCSQLRATLYRIEDFSIFLDRIADGQVPDPVNHLWDCFALGTPLCFLFNLLPPPASSINIDTDPNTVDLDPSNVKATKIAIIKFIMAVQKMKQDGNWEDSELFQVTELTDRNMDGFVKVIATVSYLVDLLPKFVFALIAPPSPPIPTAHSPVASGAADKNVDSSATLTASSKEADRRNIISELINTERKYVGDLEVMQKYATALLQRSVIDQDTILELFPGLSKLLDFQRRFLIRLEQVGEMPWVEQHWGRCFSESEAEFEVYAPYCANYDNAVEVLLREEQHLMELSTLIHPKSDLPAFLIKPVQRICKYPLLLDSLIKASSPDDYPHYQELVEGSASTKRVTARINEAQRKAENRQIMKALEARIEDWKGHHIVNFGELLLQDFFSVTKSEVDRDYHVFLFEKIILCCKEDPRATIGGSKKVSKSNSILKKNGSGVPQTPFPGGIASSARKGTTPLLLKGRIFLNNVIEAAPTGVHDLRVSWKGDDDTEHFTLRCRNEEQLKLWETQINRLITASNQRRKTSTSSGGSLANSTNPAALRMQSLSREESVAQNSYIASRYSRTATPQPHLDDRWRTQSQLDVFDMEDEVEDIRLASAYAVSGRGTPLGSRRVGSAQSMPPERDVPPGYDRPRARTEDHGGHVMQQWRLNGQGIPPPPPGSGLPYNANSRYNPSRTTSSLSVASEASFGTSIPRSSLRSQASSTRLRGTHDNMENADSISRISSAMGATSPSQNITAPYSATRSRSASLAGPYDPNRLNQLPPPVPSPYGRSPHPTPISERLKRDSGSSNTTEGSSDFSPPASNSPVSPYTSVDSAPGTLRHARSQILSSNNVNSMKVHSPPIKVKVHYGDDLFVIMVNRSTEYSDLVEKVGKKIRLCGGRRDGSPLRVKYQDEDGDMVSLGSNEDVQMAFDTTRPGGGGQVTLFVS